MNRLRLYINDSVNELFHKVSWPTWKELQSSAIVVMVASLIIAGIIFIMDVSFQAILNLFYQMFV
jgi:preprotein translocase subunit SecE